MSNKNCLCYVPTRRGFLALAASAWPASVLAQEATLRPVPKGKIALVQGDFGHSNIRKIWIINPDGTGVRPLTEHELAPGEDRPSWSPEGKRIAFSAVRGGNSRIYLRESDGSNEECITNDLPDADSPAWSPDGLKIAYCSRVIDEPRIFVMNADGGSKKQITFGNGNDWLPAWFPDSQSLAFETTRDGNREVYRVDADGGGLSRITNHKSTNHAPSVAPDGKRIALMAVRDFGSAEICTIDADGNNLRNLTKDKARDSEPAWSPDSQWIAFTRSTGKDNDFTMDIWVMRSDGTLPRNITHSDKGVSNWAPAWA